ncbi:hypothetical protein ABTX35_18875 [Streptomyces sp. NPDC096080]|uniref:hypothetical protein n=1 Tax=Streptomyces sp. NPDC096080 TaxID=3156693 RepID=UPI00332C0B9A
MTSRCPDCGLPVLVTRTLPGKTTAGGKRLAVNPDPDPAGNTGVRRDGTGAVVSRRVTEQQPLMGYERLHMPHAATCEAQQPQLPLDTSEASPTPRQKPLPEGVIRLSDYRQRRT